MARSVRMERRRGVLQFKARKLWAACLGGVLLLTSGQVGAEQLQDGLSRRDLQDVDSSPAAANTAICKLHNPKVEAPVTSELTLSEERLTATLVCSGQNVVFVPANLENVCQKPPNGKSKESEDVCKKNTNDNDSKCKLPIYVLARASTVENVVTCAYGKKSNKTPVKVEITQDQNSLTILCGQEGSIQPTEYATKYCEADGLKDCSKSYTEILPAFDEKWTPLQGTDNSAKLAIPASEFPSGDKSFYIGCTPSGGKREEGKERSAGSAAAGGSDAAPTTCKVLVTVKAAGSSLSAGAGVAMSAATSGAALLTGLVAGSL
ncbi:SAG-related sequence [Besnoitia besnoiti]|uniref:SAG-related sequence n=1 Tax=Besnoitia besnoiti TaxID=94643 RepID=A0A2A9MJ88_BESBE|nr:SAG-related sequence [Besnoitia besnoiti]PFH35657.1 SAG-related sequence [Besnoitia besnoiti]